MTDLAICQRLAVLKCVTVPLGRFCCKS